MANMKWQRRLALLIALLFVFAAGRWVDERPSVAIVSLVAAALWLLIHEAHINTGG